MIKSVTVINHLGDSLVMELKRPETSGFYIQRIDGLGPVRATVNIVERAVMDGASYNSARAGSRNIVMYLGFMFASNIEEIRHKSYKYFPIKKKVTIQIETDTRICETYGYVESNEPDIFSNGETTQISIICPDSYFHEAGPNSKNIVTFTGVESAFSFEFSNESLTDDKIVFGEIHNDIEQTISYSGDVEVGVKIYIHSLGDASNITIYNITTGEKMVINTQKLKMLLGTDDEIVNGDDIVISTSRGEKSITLLRAGERHNIINCLDRYPDWFQLIKGDNIFTYRAYEGEENLQFRVEYVTVYEGV
jgi:hypothetical protein